MAEKQDHQVTGPVSKAAELTSTKVLAGGMAAATSAVLGSQFGALGAVGAAAAGSVVTTVGTSVYQRSLERTRNTVAQRMPRPGRVGPEPAATRATTTQRPASRSAPGTDRAGSGPRSASGSAETASQPPDADRASRVAAPSTHRWVLVLLVAPVLAFTMGMGAVTGIEWIKGSALSGDSGQTSVGEMFRLAAENPNSTDSGRSEDEPSESPSPSQSSDQADRPDPRDLLPTPNQKSSESSEPDQPLLPGAEHLGGQ